MESIIDLKIQDLSHKGADDENGWTFLPTDLNKGAGGDYLYLGYKRGTGPGVTSITCESFDDPQTTNPKDGWHWSNIDLNKGAGGEYIYLFWKSEKSEQPILGLRIIANDEENPKKISDWEAIRVDLNKGAGGKYVWLYYSKEVDPDSKLGVITWNMAAGNEDYKGNLSSSRLEDFFDAYSSCLMKTDLICTQELTQVEQLLGAGGLLTPGLPASVVLKKSVDEVADIFSQNGFVYNFIVMRHGGNFLIHKYEFQGIFSRKKLLDESDKTIIEYDSDEWQRILQSVKVDFNGKKMLLLNYHNTNIDGGKEKALKDCVEELNKEKDEVDKWIFAGDFNLDYSSVKTILEECNCKKFIYNGVDYQISNFEYASDDILPCENKNLSDHDAIFAEYWLKKKVEDDTFSQKVSQQDNV
jgi:hypothetical protein